MTTKENVSDELIIVGGRYGDLADRLKLLFEQEMPIVGKDVKEKLGGNLIYLLLYSFPSAITSESGAYSAIAIARSRDSLSFDVFW